MPFLVMGEFSYNLMTLQQYKNWSTSHLHCTHRNKSWCNSVQTLQLQLNAVKVMMEKVGDTHPLCS